MQTFCRSSVLRRLAIQRFALSTRSSVVGFHRTKDGFQLTKSSQLIDEQSSGTLSHRIDRFAADLKPGESRIFFDLKPYHAVSVACISNEEKSPSNMSNSDIECLDQNKESVRKAVAAGVRALHSMRIATVEVDSCGDAKAAAEGAHLATFNFDALKTEKKSSIELHPLHSDACGDAKWNEGVVLARAQNLAREWTETPSNFMTPTIFADTVTHSLLKAAEEANVQNALTINCRDQQWIKDMGMGGVLAVSQGSDEEPKFLDIEYRGTMPEKCPSLALVGKGVTFDTGGVSIKPAANMDLMRGDMGGAAVVCASLEALLHLQSPMHIRVFVPLCENMVSGKAIKPGDVITVMNGKTIQVDNTDAEGRLILADALAHASSFQPDVLINAATLTGAMSVALGGGAAGVFCTSDALWEELYEAGHTSGDRLWRMPLFASYRKKMDGHLADLNNIGKGGGGGACTAAAFLKEFVEVKHWAHVDMAGVVSGEGELPYLSKGMTGRPARTIIETIQNIAKSLQSLGKSRIK